MRVAMLDLSASTPFYDRILAEHLAPLVTEFTLYSPGFTYDPEYYDDVSFSCSPGFTDVANRLRIRNRYLRRLVKSIEYFVNFFTVSHRITRGWYDIIHIQWLLPHLLIEYQIAHINKWQKAGTRVVYTVHNVLEHDKPNSDREFRQRLYETVDHLIVHTSRNYLHFQALYNLPPEKVSVIPHGPLPFRESPSMSREECRRKFGCGDNDILLLCAGIVRPYKGIKETLTAVALLHEDYPSLKLVVAGNPLDIDYAKSLQSHAVDLNLEKNVCWELRFVPDADLAAFYAAADIAIFAYREVSQSGAFLTAAASGVCVLVTDVGGIGEVIINGVNGLKVANNSADTLSDGLRRGLSLTPVQRTALGKQLQNDVNNKFGWSIIAQKTIQLYEHLAMKLNM